MDFQRRTPVRYASPTDGTPPPRSNSEPATAAAARTSGAPRSATTTNAVVYPLNAGGREASCFASASLPPGCAFLATASASAA